MTLPCTNVPIYCPLGPHNARTGIYKTIWKYNATHPLAGDHSSLEREGFPQEFTAFITQTFITREGEDLMGIPEHVTYKYRADNDIPNTDTMLEMKAATKPNNSAAPKRSKDTMSETGSTQSRVQNRQRWRF